LPPDAMRADGATPSFRHVALPLRLFCGPDSLGQLGRELDRVGARRAVILCGSSLARQVELLDLARDALGERFAGIFAGVKAHSPVPAVEEAAAVLRAVEADAAIAIGGGSAVVTARAAAILCAEKQELRRLCTFRDAAGKLNSPRLLAPKMPQFVIPTTPNTAVVKAGSAVFDPVDGARLALFDPKTRAQAVFIHPAMMASAPRALAHSAGLNALVLAVEGLLSLTGDPFADALLMHAIRTLHRQLAAGAGQDTPQARCELATAAVMCGQATDHTGVGITTVLGHALSARFGIENGVAKAVVLPHALRFNGPATQAGLAKLLAALGLPEPGTAGTLDAVIAAIGAVLRTMAVPSRLRDLSLPLDALPEIAAKGMLDWFLRTNPRTVRDASELLQVLEQAW
jgi:alcohol dehydrogenase class IV